MSPPRSSPWCLLAAVAVIADCGPSAPAPEAPVVVALPTASAEGPARPWDSIDAQLGRLDDPGQRPAAIRRLLQLYEDVPTRNSNDPGAPGMKALLDRIVPPMSGQYIRGDLDEKTRIDLLKSLASTRDPRAKDAIIKAIKDFAAGKASAEEMTQSAGYVKALKLKEASGPLLDAFTKIKVSDTNLGPPHLATLEAMHVVRDPAWKPKLIELLDRPIDHNEMTPDQAALPGAKDEIYWQTVSAELLGDLQATEAIRPLFKLVLQSAKRTIAATAVMALVKIGKPAVAPLLGVLAGNDREMNELARKGGVVMNFVALQNAAIVLGSIGHAEARDPMIAALSSTSDDELRGILGREIVKLPASPEAVKALETAFAKASVDSVMQYGDPVKASLATAAERFMDPSIVPWLLGSVTALRTARGDKERIDTIQKALLRTAVKLMDDGQVDAVKKAVDAAGDSPIKKEHLQAAMLLGDCRRDVSCYPEKLENAALQGRSLQFAGIKAAYMLGGLGNDSTRAEIVKRLPRIKNDSIRAEALNAIDHLSPNGDRKTADDLQAILDEQATRGETTPVDALMRQIISRLRARAA